MDHKFSVFRFEDFEVREREFLLVKGGESLPVEPKAFRVLVFLLRNPKRLVTKDEILNAVWNDCAVSDNSLTRSIATLRRQLGDDRREPRFIATVPTVGYRFLCDVVAAEEGVNGFAAEETHLPPENDTDDRPREEKQLGPQFDHGRKRLSGLSFAGLCILAAGIVAAGLLIRQAASTRDVHGTLVPHLATEERITSNPPEAPVENAVLSRDGKYLAFHDNLALYLRQIANGETRAWELPKDFVAWPDDWFPDGIHLLVTRREGPSRTLSLWKLSVLGGNPERLMDVAADGSVSPDGSRIAYMRGPKFGSELWVMDSDGANARRVVLARKPDQPNLGDSWIERAAWSPNGTRLAYVEAHLATPDPALFADSLLTCDANGGDLQVVLKDDSRLRPALWWAADGRYLNDLRSEREATGVESILMDERTGRADAPPQRVTEGQGWIGGLSATTDGKRLVVSRGNTTRQVFITEPDRGNHRWKAPRRLTLDTNESVATAWTADSKAVLFVSDRSGTWKLFKQNIDETTAEVLVEGRSMRFPRLSADGLQVIYLVESQRPDRSVTASLMSKPLAGGPPRLILRENGITNYQCARAPSQLCIFSKLVGSDHVLVSFDLEHGAGREIMGIPSGLSHWSLSPDGSRLALVLDPHRIRFLSPETGAAHEVNLNDWPVFNVDWSADGARVFIRSVTPAGVPVILALNEAGKAEVVIEGRVDSHFTFFIQSPDGRHGILEMPTPDDNNAWMVENF
jgi:DNA-binding winged helix-turn-helix (wHTH) protein/Tol biopolymer transport system component